MGTAAHAPGDSERDRRDPSLKIELAERLQYYIACARFQAEERDELRIYDNSANRVPPASALQFAGYKHSNYEQYLGCRLAAFSARGAVTQEELVEHVGDTSEARELLLGDKDLVGLVCDLAQMLREREPFEAEALARRLAQLPKHIVAKTWYRETEEFDAWAVRVEDDAHRAEVNAWNEMGANYERVLVESVDAGPHSEAYRALEYIDRRLAEALQEVRAHLRGEQDFPQSAAAAFVDLEGATLGRGLEGPRASMLFRVCRDMAQHADGRDEETLLSVFTGVVAAAADCEFADFLRWRDDRLTPVANSRADADLARLAANSYRRAQGITGSAVLIPPTARRRWVGTNYLHDDPRQAPRQTQVYEQEFGAIRDYWVFPVYSSGHFYGALRVVNRSETRWLGGMPWSDAVLFELQEVARWFEEALLPRVLGHRLRTRTGQELAHASAATQLRAELNLSWIDEDFLVSLVAHVASVAHRRVEKTLLGCCIGIFSRSPAVHAQLPRYSAVGDVELEGLDEVSSYYPRVDPRAGMFLFEPTGAVRGVVKIAGADVRELTRDHANGAVFLLERGQDCMRVFQHGRVAADYYLSDATGVWTLRTYAALAEKVASRVPDGMEADTAREAFRRAVELSYRRIGAMLILGSDVPATVRFEQHSDVATDLYVDGLDDTEFFDLAHVDGAIHIDDVGRIIRWGAIVRTTSQADARASGIGAQGGSRHSSALALSRAASNLLILVVSENRPISVLQGGECVVYRK